MADLFVICSSYSYYDEQDNNTLCVVDNEVLAQEIVNCLEEGAQSLDQSETENRWNKKYDWENPRPVLSLEKVKQPVQDFVFTPMLNESPEAASARMKHAYEAWLKKKQNREVEIANAKICNSRQEQKKKEALALWTETKAKALEEFKKQLNSFSIANNLAEIIQQDWIQEDYSYSYEKVPYYSVSL